LEYTKASCSERKGGGPRKEAGQRERGLRNLLAKNQQLGKSGEDPEERGKPGGRIDRRRSQAGKGRGRGRQSRIVKNLIKMAKKACIGGRKRAD